MKFTESLYPLSVVVCATLGGGCILTTNGEDDGNQDGESDGDDDSLDDPSAPDDDDGSGESLTDPDGTDGTGDDTDDGTTGPSGECSANLVMDPGFEAGSQGTAWAQASTTFGTPICNADCTDDANAGPFEGEYWAWFGGLEEMEAASLTQSITIPAAENALLSFRFAINATTGTGDDEFVVTVDGTNVFMVTDAEMDDYADYTHVDVDLTAYADGAAHTIRFESDHPGHPDTGLITNFFLDKVSLVTCSASGTDSGDSGSSTAADDTSTGTGDSSSTGDSGSSDSGDSSSSSTGG
jgi:hypothetical protein